MVPKEHGFLNDTETVQKEASRCVFKHRVSMFSVDVCCQTNDKSVFVTLGAVKVQLNAMCVALISILQDLKRGSFI